MLTTEHLFDSLATALSWAQPRSAIFAFAEGEDQNRARIVATSRLSDDRWAVHVGGLEPFAVNAPREALAYEYACMNCGAALIGGCSCDEQSKHTV